MKRSSTSSSEAPVKGARTPWALILAVGIALVVELLIRAAEPRHLISYQYGEDEYYAAANHLGAYGPADIAILGSSRAKEGVAVPEITEMLVAAGYDDLTVANYACAGSRADETRALAEYLLARGRPRILLCGVTPRMMLGNQPRMARSAIFWDVRDWVRAYRDDRAAAEVWPTVARNYLSRPCRTLMYRRKPVSVTADSRRAIELREQGGPTFSLPQILDGEVLPSPLNGQLTGRQIYEGDRSLILEPLAEDHVRSYVDRLLIDGEYVLGETRMREMFAMIIACREAGVQLVFFEVPLSEILRRNLPDGTYSGFLDRMETLTGGGEAWFVTVDDLQLSFDDSEFAEQSHLNLAGARKLTRALGERVILPELEEIATD